MFTMLYLLFQHPGITLVVWLATSVAFGILLGKITEYLLKAHGASFTDKTDIKGSVNTRNALTSGQVDMYWENALLVIDEKNHQILVVTGGYGT